MGIEKGRLISPAGTMTREVRWFFGGGLPRSHLDWFTSVPHTREQRVDVYDLASARNGVGRKRRDNSTMDVKFRVDVLENVQILPGVLAHVEDWMKISRPLSNAPLQHLADPLPVRKALATRRYLLSHQAGSGCEAELSEVEIDGAMAWSLCFETFGEPTERGAALQSGLEQFSAETPLPRDLRLGTDASLSYPDWISRIAFRAA